MGLPLAGRGGMNRLRDGLRNRLRYWLRHWLRHWQPGQERRSSLDAIAGLHLDGGIAIEQNINARAKLDEPNPLAAGHVVSHVTIENDTAGDEAGDLLEDYGTARAFHGDDVLLVLLRRIRSHSVEELAALIAHVADHAGNRRAVHVHIEDAEEDADPVPRSPAGSHQRYIGHFAIAGRNDRSRDGGNLALGVAEKPEEESRQQQHRNGIRPNRQPRDNDRGKHAARSVEVAVTHHGNLVRTIIWRKSFGCSLFVARGSWLACSVRFFKRAASDGYRTTNNSSLGARQNRRVVVDPVALLGSLWNRGSARGPQGLDRGFWGQAFRDQQTSGDQSSTANSLPAMDDNVLSRRKIS